MNLNIKINEAYCVLNTLENTPTPLHNFSRLPSETNLNMISLCLKSHNFYQLILRDVCNGLHLRLFFNSTANVTQCSNFLPTRLQSTSLYA